MQSRCLIRFLLLSSLMFGVTILGGCDGEWTDTDETEAEEAELAKVELYGQEEKEVLKIVSRILGRPENEISSHLSLSQLRAGNLEVVEIVSRVEERFQIRISAAAKTESGSSAERSQPDISRLSVSDLVSQIRRSRLATESP